MGFLGLGGGQKWGSDGDFGWQAVSRSLVQLCRNVSAVGVTVRNWSEGACRATFLVPANVLDTSKLAQFDFSGTILICFHAACCLYL